MHSTCFVVLPNDLFLDNENIYKFVKNHISKYYSELEVEPYKQFFSKERTLEIAKRKGFTRLDDFEEYLKTHSDNDGMENGLYYWITTFNTQGRWDGFILDDVKNASSLKDELPYSVVTPDGIWHSQSDYGYKPILNFNKGGQHSENIEPEKKWRNYLNNFFKEYEESYLAIIDVHS